MLDSAVATLGLALLGAAVSMLVLPEPAAALSLDQLVNSVEGVVAEAGFLGPLVFILAYALATVLLVPGSLLTLGAGALFGPMLGTAVVSAASTLGASAAFLVGRYLARPAVERRIAANPKFAAVDSAIAAKGPRIVLLLRLSPLFPFTLLNYALSLTKVEFWPYVLSSWAGMLPGTVAYVSLGGVGRAAAESASGSGLDPVKLGLYIVGAVATLWVARIISQIATRALQEASDEVHAGKVLGGLHRAQQGSTASLTAGQQPAAMSTAHESKIDWYRHGLTSLTPNMTMAHTLKRLGTSLEVVPQTHAVFVKPQTVLYEMDGKARKWEMVVSHPSVAILLFHTEKKAVILVRQFRPAVYISAVKEAELAGRPKPDLTAGFTHELCAGIIDKPHLDLKGIAHEEILEECGYNVPTDRLHEVTSFISAIGISGSRQTIFAAEVDESMRVQEGGGGLVDHGEAIEVLALPVEQIESFIVDQELHKSGGILFGLVWLQAQLRQNGGRIFGSSR
ncbi:hypothetical protein N2152v2_003010 [Parachlorella kessleri]